MSRGLSTAAARWAGMGPYYAMFPVNFTTHVVETYSTAGQTVLDPFAGRATGIYAAATTGRSGIGIEINPVGWRYGRVKLRPASCEQVLARLQSLDQAAKGIQQAQLTSLPAFFSHCYAPNVLRFLLAARHHLAWKTDQVDATLMAIVLIYLHAKLGGGLSNQMRQGKSMAPDYSVRWWNTRRMDPPDLDPIAFLKQRICWRYAKGTPNFPLSVVHLGDSTSVLPSLASEMAPASLLLTSPPYYEITNYHYDQWLRLWLLGGPVHPTKCGMGPHQGRFESQTAYRSLIEQVFAHSAPLLAPDAVIYVRADARSFTQQIIREALTKHFPTKRMWLVNQPVTGRTQTSQFGDWAPKPGEVDFILES